jgi:hypothetical protein
VEYIANAKRIKGESTNICENVPKKELGARFSRLISSSPHCERSKKLLTGEVAKCAKEACCTLNVELESNDVFCYAILAFFAVKGSYEFDHLRSQNRRPVTHL